jgi:hypothetical protein
MRIDRNVKMFNMNWGYKLMFVFIAFAAFMGFMVYSCLHSPISLVSAEYYKDELNYQQVIDATESSNKLSTQVKVIRDGEYVQLQLPPEMKQLSPTGSVWFYYVRDGKIDRKFPLATDKEGVQLFELKDFSKGKYIVKIEWKAQEINYYKEKEIIIE